MLKHFKSKTQLFNGAMLLVDTILLNAMMVQDLLSVKEFAATILVLKVIQSMGNFYLRSVTKESLDAK